MGTGFAAKLRAETLRSDDRAELVAVAGHIPEQTREFAQTYGAAVADSWQQLLERDDLDLVCLCAINRDRGLMARRALEWGKHVVAEYPLALDPADAAAAIALARQSGKLLHVEHIELLGGVHQAFTEALSRIEPVQFVSYSTLTPKHPAPRKWTYRSDLFGFPLVGALSRLHRLVSVFGKVERVSCEARFWDATPPTPDPFHASVLCSAQLRFASGAIARVLYGKGEIFHSSQRCLEAIGAGGTLVFDGSEGTLIRGDDREAIAVGARRGLFARDTTMVLNRLIDGTPLYVTPEDSLYTLQVADATRRAAQTGEAIRLEN